MRATVCFLVISLCAASQGSRGIVSEFEAEAKKEYNELKQIVMDVGMELKDALEEVRTGLHVGMQEGLLHIDSTVDEALVIAARAPVVCRTGVAEHLATLKKASFWEFLKCSNLTKLLEEGGSMAYDVAKIVGTVMTSVDRLVNLPTHCMSWNPWSMFKCYYNAIKTIKNEVLGDIKAVRDFIANIKELGQEFKGTFHHCLYPDNNSTSTIQADVANVLNKVNECVKTGKPVRLH